MDDGSIEVRPHWGYWLACFLVYPLGGFIFTAMPLEILSDIFHFKITPQLILATWAAVTLGLAAFFLGRDYKNLFYVLTPTALHLGRGANPAQIHFDDVHSIVPGLPARQTWWLRILTSVQKLDSLFRDEGLISASRRRAVLVRMSERRYAALLLNVRFLVNGDALTDEFLKRNAKKIAGHETYTGLEKSRLSGHVSFNSIFRIDGAKGV